MTRVFIYMFAVLFLAFQAGLPVAKAAEELPTEDLQAPTSAESAESAALPSEEELMARLQESYGSMSTFRADFTQEQIHEASGDVQEYQGILHLKKPFLLRSEVVAPATQLILLTEDYAWQYFAEDNTAYKYLPDMSSEMGLLFRVLTGQSRLDQEFTVNSISWDNGLILIKARPVEPIAQMVRAEIWVDLESGFITRLRSVDFSYTVADIRLHDITLDENLPDDLFVFTPPEGVKIEDNTQF